MIGWAANNPKFNIDQYLSYIGRFLTRPYQKQLLVIFPVRGISGPVFTKNEQKSLLYGLRNCIQ